MGNIQEALSWNNVVEQAADLGIGSGGGYFTIQEGENIVRILTEPIHYGVYFMGKGNPPVFAKNASEEIKTNTKLSHKFACYVYNTNEEKVQIAEFGWSIAKAIGELSDSSQYKYKGIPPFDLIITKKGSGMKTEYSVQAGRNEDKLSAEIMAEFNEKDDIEMWLGEKQDKEASIDTDNVNATVEEKEQSEAVTPPVAHIAPPVEVTPPVATEAIPEVEKKK